MRTFCSFGGLLFVFVSIVSCGSNAPLEQASAGNGGASAAGGSSATGGSAGSGVNAGGSSAGSGGVPAGGAGSGAGGTTGPVGGNGGAGGSSPDPVTPGGYALPPPDQCKNQFYVAGCEEGNAESACGGVCTSRNACEDGKSGEPGFACPRYMLFADEMAQAAKDDAALYGWSTTGESPFEYAVVGHDTDSDPNGVDDPEKSPCCQCYQLIPYEPEQQVKDQMTMQPTVPLPKPLIVQAFNTGATTKTFDVYMGHGGLGGVQFPNC